MICAASRQRAPELPSGAQRPLAQDCPAGHAADGQGVRRSRQVPATPYASERPTQVSASSQKGGASRQGVPSAPATSQPEGAHTSPSSHSSRSSPLQGAPRASTGAQNPATQRCRGGPTCTVHKRGHSYSECLLLKHSPSPQRKRVVEMERITPDYLVTYLCSTRLRARAPKPGGRAAVFPAALGGRARRPSNLKPREHPHGACHGRPKCTNAYIIERRPHGLKSETARAHLP